MILWFLFQHFALLSSLYCGAQLCTGNMNSASWAPSLYTNWRFTYAAVTGSLTNSPESIEFYGTLLASYYGFDLCLSLWSQKHDKWSSVAHHVVTLWLLVLHSLNVLPMTMGLQFVVLFEYSNVFLLLFQMCNEMHWSCCRDLVAYPFALTYVPIRLVMIPLYSLKYVSVVWDIQCWSLAVSCGLLLAFLDIFSIYYAVVVSTKFIAFAMKRKPKAIVQK